MRAKLASASMLLALAAATGWAQEASEAPEQAAAAQAAAAQAAAEQTNAEQASSEPAAAATAPPSDDSPFDYTASEEISEDLSVSFPVDI